MSKMQYIDSAGLALLFLAEEGRGTYANPEGGGPAEEAEPTATLRTFRSGAGLGYKKKGWAKDVFFGQNIVLDAAVGAVLTVGDAVVATPRRPRGLFSRGLRNVDYPAKTD